MILTRAQFLDRLPVARMTLHCPVRQAVTGLASGQMLRAEVGPALWQGEVVLGRMTDAEAAEAEALVDLAAASGVSFLVGHSRRRAPVADPSGALLGAAEPVLGGVNADGDGRLRILALPANYPLAIGDLFGFAWTDGGGRPQRALHRIAEPVTVGAGGSSSPFLPWPPLRPAAGGTAVDLIAPSCRAIVPEGGVTPGGAERWMTEGLSFLFVESFA
ncbi:MAG: hypothetical protein ACK4QW_16015 [Alphaproteobacteria bacterium]